MNYKKVLTIVEHIVLVSLIAGTVGFYFGNQYGTRHIDVNTLKQAPVASQALK